MWILWEVMTITLTAHLIPPVISIISLFQEHISKEYFFTRKLKRLKFSSLVVYVLGSVVNVTSCPVIGQRIWLSERQVCIQGVVCAVKKL